MRLLADFTVVIAAQAGYQFSKLFEWTLDQLELRVVEWSFAFNRFAWPERSSVIWQESFYRPAEPLKR